MNAALENFQNTSAGTLALLACHEIKHIAKKNDASSYLFIVRGFTYGCRVK